MNTFPLPKVEVAEMAFGHDDGIRRKIWEANGRDFSVQHFFIHGGQELGNHAHMFRNELFTITKGTGKLYLQSVDSSTDQLVGELITVDLMPGIVVQIKIYTAHTFVFDYVEDENGNEILSEMWQHSDSPFSTEDAIRTPLAIAPVSA